MSTHYGESAVRPEPDKVVQDIADYVHDYKIDSDLAWETARLCLIDTIGCGLEGLRFVECRNLLGPVVEGTIVPNGNPTLPSFARSAPLIPRFRNESPRD
jgi:2-methylcitrate dehydratase